MDTLLSFLGGLSPVLQVILTLLLCFIFRDDISGFFKQKFGGGEVKGEVADWRELLLGQMQELSLHFNHQTTEGQERLESGITVLSSKIDDHVRQQDRTNYLLEDIKNNGIYCRKK